jgi:hypothetical protein
MRLVFTFLLVLFGGLTIGFAQQSLKGRHIEQVVSKTEKKDLQINYSVKINKEGKSMLKIRFFNKTKASLKVDLVLGIYSNGVLLEKADIVDCLKKSFLNNFFRPNHLVETTISETKGLEIDILNILTEVTDECRPSHK